MAVRQPEPAAGTKPRRRTLQRIVGPLASRNATNSTAPQFPPRPVITARSRRPRSCSGPGARRPRRFRARTRARRPRQAMNALTGCGEVGVDLARHRHADLAGAADSATNSSLLGRIMVLLPTSRFPARQAPHLASRTQKSPHPPRDESFSRGTTLVTCRRCDVPTRVSDGTPANPRLHTRPPVSVGVRRN